MCAYNDGVEKNPYRPPGTHYQSISSDSKDERHRERWPTVKERLVAGPLISLLIASCYFIFWYVYWYPTDASPDDLSGLLTLWILNLLGTTPLLLALPRQSSSGTTALFGALAGTSHLWILSIISRGVVKVFSADGMFGCVVGAFVFLGYIHVIGRSIRS